jgi:hypothetical protein
VPPTSEYVHAGYPATVLEVLSDVLQWWDGVELWLTQLGLALQVTLLMLVVVPICWWAARIFDRAVGLVFERLEHRYAVDAEDAQEPR